MSLLTGPDFGQLFDRAQRSAFRLETLPVYDVPQDKAGMEAWRAGRAQPERSVRTSPWLARLAVTAAAGRAWQRARLVSEPPSEYERYEFGGYIESQACGEEIRVAVRTTELAAPGDFWLFDAGGPDAFAAVMRYDAGGRFLGAELATAAGVLQRLEAARDAAWDAARPLNEYLATAAPLRATA